MTKYNLTETWLTWDGKEHQYHKREIWDGEADTIYFGKGLVAMPDFISVYGNEVAITFPQYSNVRIEMEGKNAWCVPAMTAEELVKLERQNKEREELGKRRNHVQKKDTQEDGAGVAPVGQTNLGTGERGPKNEEPIA